MPPLPPSWDAIKEAIKAGVVEGLREGNSKVAPERDAAEKKTFEAIAAKFGTTVANKIVAGQERDKAKRLDAQHKALRARYAPTLGHHASNLHEKAGSHVLGVGGALIGASVGMAAVESGRQASPVAFMMMQQAVADLGAVVGRVVVPVMQIFTDRVRLFGDFMATILPTQAEFNEIFKAMHPVFESLRTTLTELAPVFKAAFLHGLQQAVIIINGFAKAIGALIEQIIPFIKMMGGNLEGFGKPGELKSSYGASGFQGSIKGFDDYKNSMIMNAFASVNPMDQTAKNTEEMKTKLDQLIVNTMPGDGVKRAIEGAT